MKKIVFLVATHLITAAAGFAAGVYFLPILTAPPAPPAADIQEMADTAIFSGEFRRDLQDSDALHWGEGRVFVGRDAISLEGRLAPGPDYKLYLSPEFVETEADFKRLKSTMARVGDVKTFENFIVPVPATVDPAEFTALIVWCESFGQFITAAEYRQASTQ